MFDYPANEENKNPIETKTRELISEYRFNEIIYDEVMSKLKRHGFAAQTMEKAETSIRELLWKNLNDNIVNLIQLDDLSKNQNTFYRMPPLNNKRASKYAVQLFNEPELIDNECEEIVAAVYPNLSKEDRRVKSLAIRMLTIYTFWIDLKYITTEISPEFLFVNFN